MNRQLVIVESPAKAKTIEKYLGKGYQVASCYGHIRDLPKKSLSIDLQDNFRPTYQVSQEKKGLVKQLKAWAAAAQRVYLASDDDREGEAIAWHLQEVLALKKEKTRRIVFREITKSAVLTALQNPRGIDRRLVDAQQARRLLDRLVGYEVSPILWKKVQGGLSAGRVQSVALRLVVERERAIAAFVPVSSFAVRAQFELEGGQVLEAALPARLEGLAAARQFLEKCVGADFTIEDLATKGGKKSPAPPFTTASLQQEASSRLGYSVQQTMVLAQRLYEAGKISYMRTDSVYLSKEAVASAEQEIVKAYGKAYFEARAYKSRAAGAQEAHEAIRPTDFSRRVASKDGKEQRLYELIWQRAMASQMAEAKVEKTVARIAISTAAEVLIAQGEVVKFAGFLKVYRPERGEGEAAGQGLLPPLKVGQALLLGAMQAQERFSKAPARYTEASLVKELEKRGIGRPSTYAATIGTIQKRGYVLKEDRPGQSKPYQVLTLEGGTIEQAVLSGVIGAAKQQLFPSAVALAVNDFLVKHFAEMTDYSFTAQVEASLDAIAQGKQSWKQMLAAFYSGFSPQVARASLA